MDDIPIAVVVCPCPVGDVQGNLARMRHYTRKAAGTGARLICFPELNITGYTTRKEAFDIARPISGDISRTVGEMARDENITILCGLAEKAPDGLVYAAHMSITPDGKLRIYRKLHIAPPETGVFSAGSRLPICRIPGLRFGIQLCYDAHFPELATAMALKGIDALFIPHASPRGTPDEKYRSWMRHLSARAFDNAVYVVASNQSGSNDRGLVFPGLAIVIGPSGEVEARLATETEGMLTATLRSASIKAVREHRMRYFLPNRRADIFGDMPAGSR